MTDPHRLPRRCGSVPFASAFASANANGVDVIEEGPAEGLVRVRFDLAYDGTDFSGWARQRARRTVQGELESAITTVLRLREPVELTVAGRTDAGVHARGQV